LSKPAKPAAAWTDPAENRRVIKQISLQALGVMMKNDVRRWMAQDGEKFLKEVGVKKGQDVLDFGSGKGNYTIPASKVVGANARVYAVDKDKEVLDKLGRRLKKTGIANVELVNGKAEVSLSEDSVDAILCYDVIHLVGKNNKSTVKDRMKLYKIIKRIARKNALVSIYPSHLVTHTDVASKQEIKKEVEQAGFIFEREIYTGLIHDDHKVHDYVLNFRKR
jgi:ubiquinone/menaquinone biosynthesis C-methylase UbiE